VELVTDLSIFNCQPFYRITGLAVCTPRAAERATMVTFVTLGNIAAALIGGALIGWILTEERETNHDSR
jgi:hypothetical protein